MIKSESRARPRKTGTAAGKTASTARKAAKPAAAKKIVAAKKATTATARKSAAVKKSAPPVRKSVPRKPATHTPAAAPKPPRTRGKPRPVDPFERLRALVLGALDDLKARDVQEIDVRGKSSVADLLVIASGTSTRHVKSIADEVVKKAKQAGMPPLGVEGQREAEWVLVDLGDVIVHVMLPRAREFYGLERLWSVDNEQPSIE